MNCDGSLIFDTKIDQDGLKKQMSNLSSMMKKGFAVASAAKSAAILKVGKDAIDAYASYEQLVGGIDTLFKDSSDKMVAYAAGAYKTAGLSANAYMETVTSFSASLLQSLEGDTERAANAADRTITDMSDNANKMGTDMQRIQDAYQGFSKQNYTMLDNLKLGYGGTKTEMERLLRDAEELSGLKFDISSFADITEAIHIIQTEMGITGTTAKEASTTIQGSWGSLAGAWTNLMVGMADPTQDLDKLVDNVADSAMTYLDNLLPRIGAVASSFGELIPPLGIVIDNFGLFASAAASVGAGVLAYKGAVLVATAAQNGFNLSLTLNPIGATVAAIVALTVAVAALGKAYESEYSIASRTLAEEKKAWDELTESVHENELAGISEIDRTRELSEELKLLCNDKGMIQEKDKERVSFILSELNEALGTEHTLNGNIISDYATLAASVDTLIAKKRAEIILNANEEAYTEAIKKRNELMANQLELVAELEDYKKKNADFTGIYDTEHPYYNMLTSQIEESKALIDAEEAFISQFESDQAAILKGNAEGIAEINARVTEGIKTSSEASLAELESQLCAAYANYQSYLSEVESGERGAGDAAVLRAKSFFDAAKAEYEKAGGISADYVGIGFSEGKEAMQNEVDTTIEGVGTAASTTALSEGEKIGENLAAGVANGIKQNPELVKTASYKLVDTSILHMKNKGVIQSPSKRTRDEVGKFLGLGVAEGITESTPRVCEAFDAMLDRLDMQRDFDIINEEDYYKELERLRDTYFAAGSKEWLQYTKKIYDYQKKQTEEQKNIIKNMYDSISDYANEKLREVINRQEAFSDKLSGFVSIANKNTITIGGQTSEFMTMHDVGFDIEKITAYYEGLDAFRNRVSGMGFEKNVIDSYMDELFDMDKDELISFMNHMRASSDDDIFNYLSKYAEALRLSEGYSSRFYEGDMNDAWQAGIQNMREELTKAGFEIPEAFFLSGSISAEKFGEAFCEELDKQLESVRTKVTDFTGKLQLTLSGNEDRRASNTYNTTYNLTASSGENTRSQLEACRSFETLQRFRGN